MNLSEDSSGHPRMMRQFAALCRSSGASEQASRLHQAVLLAGLGPRTAQVEAMISAGAFESAALALIGEDTGWMLSRGIHDRCLASLIASGMDSEVTCEAQTPALALLAAWADAGLCGAGPGSRAMVPDTIPDRSRLN